MKNLHILPFFIMSNAEFLSCPPQLISACDSLTEHIRAITSSEASNYIEAILSSAQNSLEGGLADTSLNEGHVQVVKYYIKAVVANIANEQDEKNLEVWKKQVRKTWDP